MKNRFPVCHTPKGKRTSWVLMTIAPILSLHSKRSSELRSIDHDGVWRPAIYYLVAKQTKISRSSSYGRCQCQLVHRLFLPYVVRLYSSCRGALCWDLTWGLPERPPFRHQTCFNGSTGVTTQARMGLFQLPNAHLVFAFNGHFVLSPTLSLKIWRRLFIGQWSLGQLFLEVWEWNTMILGSVGFVYLGAALRIRFLSGLRIGEHLVCGKSGDQDGGNFLTAYNFLSASTFPPCS